MEEQEEGIRELLVEVYPKRGVLIEVSYSESRGRYLLNEIEKRIQEQSPETRAMFLVIDLKQPTDEREKTTGGNQKEQEFLITLKKLWETQETILKALKDGINVIVSHYVFDLIITSFSENVFECRESTDRMAFVNLLSYFKKIAAPDLVLSFPEYPRIIEEKFNSMCLEKLKPAKTPEPSKDTIICSKMYQKEAARDSLGGFFDSLRTLDSDLISLRDCFSYVLLTSCQKQFTRIKFY